jgi:hypothetical protein
MSSRKFKVPLGLLNMSTDPSGTYKDGDIYYNVTSHQIRIFYSSQWNNLSASGIQGIQGTQGYSIQGITGIQGLNGIQGVQGAQGTVGRYIVSDTVPSSPTTGDIWFNSLTARTFTYYDSYWVESSSAFTGTGTSGTSLDDSITMSILFGIL